mgnify:CR=1 FL=1
MRVKILKSFPFSRDGLTTLQAVAGSDEDIPDRLISGLQSEGFVGKDTTRVEIPEEQLQSLSIGYAQPKNIETPELPMTAVGRDDVPQRDRRRRGK